MSAQATFDVGFLQWLRKTTEAAWRDYKTRDFVAQKRTGSDWMAGTKWLADLSDEAVLQIEVQWNLKFPSQYRLFLCYLHAIDHPMIQARFGDGGIKLERGIAFYNWQVNKLDIKQALSEPIEGVLFDVLVNGLWLRTWGRQPDAQSEKELIVRERLAHAPKLIPFIENQYIVDATNIHTNIVLSVVQSDIILSATNLRQFFVNEFTTLLKLEPSAILDDSPALKLKELEQIPLWGELAMRNYIS